MIVSLVKNDSFASSFSIFAFISLSLTVEVVRISCGGSCLHAYLRILLSTLRWVCLMHWCGNFAQTIDSLEKGLCYHLRMECSPIGS